MARLQSRFLDADWIGFKDGCNSFSFEYYERLNKAGELVVEMS